MALSLQLGQMFVRIETLTEDTTNLFYDLILFLILFVLWANSLGVVKKGRDQNANIGDWLNRYTLGPFIIASFSITIELIWRIILG